MDFDPNTGLPWGTDPFKATSLETYQPSIHETRLDTQTVPASFQHQGHGFLNPTPFSVDSLDPIYPTPFTSPSGRLASNLFSSLLPTSNPVDSFDFNALLYGNNGYGGEANQNGVDDLAKPTFVDPWLTGNAPLGNPSGSLSTQVTLDLPGQEPAPDPLEFTSEDLETLLKTLTPGEAQLPVCATPPSKPRQTVPPAPKKKGPQKLPLSPESPTKSRPVKPKPKPRAKAAKASKSQTPAQEFNALGLTLGEENPSLRETPRFDAEAEALDPKVLALTSNPGQMMGGNPFPPVSMASLGLGNATGWLSNQSSQNVNPQAQPALSGIAPTGGFGNHSSAQWPSSLNDHSQGASYSHIFNSNLNFAKPPEGSVIPPRFFMPSNSEQQSNHSYAMPSKSFTFPAPGENGAHNFSLNSASHPDPNQALSFAYERASLPGQVPSLLPALPIVQSTNQSPGLALSSTLAPGMGFSQSEPQRYLNPSMAGNPLESSPPMLWKSPLHSSPHACRNANATTFTASKLPDPIDNFQGTMSLYPNRVQVLEPNYGAGLTTPPTNCIPPSAIHSATPLPGYPQNSAQTSIPNASIGFNSLPHSIGTHRNQSSTMPTEFVSPSVPASATKKGIFTDSTTQKSSSGTPNRLGPSSSASPSAKRPLRTSSLQIGAQKQTRKPSTASTSVFVNFTSKDSQKLLSGVAPSGSSKRKRAADGDVANAPSRAGEPSSNTAGPGPPTKRRVVSTSS